MMLACLLNLVSLLIEFFLIRAKVTITKVTNARQNIAELTKGLINRGGDDINLFACISINLQW